MRTYSAVYAVHTTSSRRQTPASGKRSGFPSRPKVVVVLTQTQQKMTKAAERPRSKSPQFISTTPQRLRWLRLQLKFTLLCLRARACPRVFLSETNDARADKHTPTLTHIIRVTQGANEQRRIKREHKNAN